MIDWLLSFFENRTFGAARSPKWSQVRKAYIALHPRCAVCEAKGGILKPNQVHHKMPFHLNLALELDEKNLITFCSPHHLLVGHLMNFRSYNVNVENDSDYFRKKIENRP